MENLVDRVRVKVLGPHLLQDLTLLSLGSTVDDAISRYGPFESEEPNEHLSQSSRYRFRLNDLHLVDVWQWNGRVHAVVYHSAKGDPDMDLKTMFKFYGEDKNWLEVNEGYTYDRDDKNVRLWCSAMPSIGVGTAEYMAANAKTKRMAEDGG
ncbi:MAG: hypothetical protein AAF989_04025 [Planctomycetota bacterium]